MNFLSDNNENSPGAECKKIFLGFSPNKNINLDMLIILFKAREFILDDKEVIIFIADIHAMLEGNYQDTLLLIERTKYYEIIIIKIMELMGIPRDKYTLAKGTDHQLDKRYIYDLYKMATLVDINELKKAINYASGGDTKNKLSYLLYPIMQVLDQTIFDSDLQIGGEDQKKIFDLAAKYAPKLGYTEGKYLLCPMLMGLNGLGKMKHASPDNQIFFSDMPAFLADKIYKANYTVYGKVKNQCALFDIVKYIIFCTPDPEFMKCKTWGQFVEKWRYGLIDEITFKNKLIFSLNNIIKPIREELYKDNLFELCGFS